MKKIVIIPAKNEEWILVKTLEAMSLFADHIIVADANSWDRTKEICLKFPKVVWVEAEKEFSTTENRRQILINKAREFGSDNLIFAFDADEIPTANIFFDQKFWETVNNLKPGRSLALAWVMLWKSATHYRVDKSVWTDNYKPVIFRDDGKTNYAPGNVHESRVPAGFDETAVNYEAVKILHYSFALWDRMLSKQAHWRIMEFLKMGRSPLKINFRYGITKEEKGIKLAALPETWVGVYKEKGIDVNHFDDRQLYWFDVEVLRLFEKNGAAHFRWLDIWDINWEQKRTKALALSYAGVPKNPIKDPRGAVIKFYHWLLRLLPIGTILAWYSSLKGVFTRHGKA